ncbi:hypothetical protein BDN70DRAFT_997235 [Pholiota conissans]|uniref:Uncharacterized protein n=1 Tax=Pholiota conissans TaxID=109636 RepID=A0A9P5YS86_9AGAR|nr:hypothetical protein BDN70DRAFT_997235 [Pholiota conissans]
MTRRHVFDMAGNVFAMKDWDLDVVWLSNPLSNTQERTLGVRLPAMTVQRLAIDPTQDLLILVEDVRSPVLFTGTRTLRVHIRSLSTASVHPLACKSSFEMCVTQAGVFNSRDYCKVPHIAGDIFMMCLLSYGRLSRTETKVRTVILNWRASELVYDTDVMLDTTPTSGVCLLDPDYFFIASDVGSGCIRLYRLVRSNIKSPRVHLATLYFPTINRNARISNISSSAGAIEVQPHPGSSFIVNNDDRLHALRIEYGVSLDLDRPLAVNIFVHQRVFMKFISQHLNVNSPLEVPWEDWGPSNTALVYPACTLPRWFPGKHVYSQRVIASNLFLGEQLDSINIWDFSLATIKAAKEFAETSSGEFRGVLFPSRTVYASEVPLFEADVKTSLPFVAWRLEVGKHRHYFYFLHANGFAGMKLTSDFCALDVYSLDE